MASTRRLLVTGGAGFIGSNFVQHWAKTHPQDRLVALDLLTYAGNLANLESLQQKPLFRFVKGDIRNQELVEGLLTDERLDTIVHFAAESHVDRSIAGPDPFIDVNIVGTYTLLKAARAMWVDGPNPTPEHRFHHVSTDEVYGSLDADDPAFEETTAYAPNSPYAASKAASDHLVRAYQHTFGLQTTISNCSNNYGPFQFPEKLIPLCIVNLLEGRKLPIYGKGDNVRDWLHVEDHCAGIEAILANGVVGETYNIGGNSERSNIELVRVLCALIDAVFEEEGELKRRFPQAPPARGQKCDERIEFVTDRPGHDQRYAINAQKIQTDLGFQPRTQLERGLQDTVRWYLSNEAWWRSVLDESYRNWIDQQYSKGTSS